MKFFVTRSRFWNKTYLGKYYKENYDEFNPHENVTFLMLRIANSFCDKKTKKTVAGGRPVTVHYIQNYKSTRGTKHFYPLRQKPKERRANDLFTNPKMSSTVFLPACSIAVKTKWSFFAVTDCMNPSCANSLRNQVHFR